MNYFPISVDVDSSKSLGSIPITKFNEQTFGFTFYTVTWLSQFDFIRNNDIRLWIRFVNTHTTSFIAAGDGNI